MPDLTSMTVKLEQGQYEAICRAANALDVSRSELNRQGMDFWLAILEAAPSLVEYDKRSLARLAGKIGKIIAVLEND